VECVEYGKVYYRVENKFYLKITQKEGWELETKVVDFM